MGAIMFFIRENGEPRGTYPASATGAPPESKRIHFQRGNPVHTVPSIPMPRSPTRQLSPAMPAFAPEPFVTDESFQGNEPVHTEESATEVILPPAVVAVGRSVISADPALAGARLSGRAYLMFRPPPEIKLPLDPKCAVEHRGAAMTRHYVVGKDNGLADVLVVFTGGVPQREWPVPQQPVTLRIRGCVYENHVVAVQSNQQILVANLDTVLHNLHNIGENNRERSIALMPRQRPLDLSFPEPERFMRFKCDVHPWEFAYVSVIEHPFFSVSDANGNFAINGLPPGRYTIEAHHRKAGMLRREVIIEERNQTLDFQFRDLPAQARNI